MPKTRVVNCRKEEYDVLVGRPSKWGNPFEIGKDGNRYEVIMKYKEWIQTQPELLAALGELKGKRLGCFCVPKACHGSILAQMADALEDTNVRGNE